MNLLAFLYGPGRWEALDPYRQTFTIYVDRVEGRFVTHCREVDLMSTQADMPLVDAMNRLGLCAMFQIPDEHECHLKIKYIFT